MPLSQAWEREAECLRGLISPITFLAIDSESKGAGVFTGWTVRAIDFAIGFGGHFASTIFLETIVFPAE